MLITCKCLNVSISVKGDSIQSIDVASLGLSSDEQNDAFFKEELGTVDLVRISKEQPSLVQIRMDGSWVVHYCLNCSLDTHAINREKGASFVLISRKMVSDPAEVTKLQSSVLYSPVFRIIVNSTDETSLGETKLTAHMPSSVQAALSALQQQLHESIQRVVQEVEERVRTFSDQQYAHLDEFRRRAHEDHRALAKLLFEKFDGDDKPILGANLRAPSSIPTSTFTPSLPPPPEMKRPTNVIDNRSDRLEDPTELRSPGSSGDGSGNWLDFGRSAPMQFNRSARGSGSIDSEGLFSLEGITRNVGVISDDELETDDTTKSGLSSRATLEPNEGDQGGEDSREARFGRRYASPGEHVSRSLPMVVPTPGRSERNHYHDDGSEFEEEDIEGVSPKDPMYIAASIKALARSVYGDTPFGELPRPRFSSQI